jgi:glutaredoxin-like protein
MPELSIIVYATEWCSDCRRAKRFLDQHNIPYQWVNIDHDKEAEQLVIKTNQGMRSVPTIICSDGTVLVEPSDQQLAQQFFP